jgi:hypothetical protein
MSGWVHTAVDTTDGIPCCWECWAIGSEVCEVATPDPASPCGFTWLPGKTCGLPESEHFGKTGMEAYQPTRCTCGHPIEERA